MFTPFQLEESSKKDRSSKEKRATQIQVDSKDVKSGAHKSESERQTADGGKTTETKSEMVENQKSSSTTNNKTVDETTTTTTKSIVIKADVHSGSIAQEESVATAAAAPADSANATAPTADAGTKDETKETVQSKSESGQVENDEKKSIIDEKVSIETTTVQEQTATATQSNAAITVEPPTPTPSPQPPPSASSSPIKTDASQEKSDDAKPAENAAQDAPKEETAKKLTIESIAATKMAASAVAAVATTKPSQDAAAATGDGNQAESSEAATKSETDKKAEDTAAPKDQTESQSQAAGNAESSAAATENVADAKAAEKNPNVDASESFQVLPKDKQQQQQPSDNLNQEKDDTGNLVPPNPPTGEPIRKTSFTVLKSDESIDDVLAGMNGIGIGVDDDGQMDSGNHAKSFKVLKAHGASGEDIILQQSSDQETGGNDNYDDYVTRNLAAYSGKYSDSELISGQLNGRRKKYKKRAKSVKQLTIVDGLSKDQDSGFEPSPRTVRASSQRAATTRAIYTANLPERPRVGDIIESVRKPGDKNAVNMSTVQATLQRNIRRYVCVCVCECLCIQSTRK